MRRLAFIIVALAMAGGCSSTIESALENQPCVADNECGGKQTCVRTDAESLADLPGQCLPESDACDGQLGCPCDPDGLDCLSSLADYPDMICDSDQLVCVVEPQDDEPEEETEG